MHVLPFHPLDVVGWDGCLYPYVFNVADYEPITGRIHQPPPAHQVFEGWNFVVCNFVPRKVDYHPLAIPVPYYHSNVDSDEVMFYVDGDYEARKGSGIGKGSVSLHPGGHPHGPQPGAVEASLGAEFFDELAVMVDTFRPLELGEAGRASTTGSTRAPGTGRAAEAPILGAVSIAPLEEEVTATGGDVAADAPWVTIVWNDPVNLMSYVTYVLQPHYGYSRRKAEKLMMDVHLEGRAVVANGSREAMEADTEALHGYGLWATFQKDR